MTVYLIHLDAPIGQPQSDEARAARGLPPRVGTGHVQSQHYLGYTDNLEERLQHHREGNGSRFMAVAKEQGISWQVVRTWEGDRSRERRMKKHHHLKRFCPICNPHWSAHEKDSSCSAWEIPIQNQNEESQ